MIGVFRPGVSMLLVTSSVMLMDISALEASIGCAERSTREEGSATSLSSSRVESWLRERRERLLGSKEARARLLDESLPPPPESLSSEDAEARSRCAAFSSRLRFAPPPFFVLLPLPLPVCLFFLCCCFLFFFAETATAELHAGTLCLSGACLTQK